MVDSPIFWGRLIPKILRPVRVIPRDHGHLTRPKHRNVGYKNMTDGVHMSLSTGNDVDRVMKCTNWHLTKRLSVQSRHLPGCLPQSLDLGFVAQAWLLGEFQRNCATAHGSSGTSEGTPLEALYLPGDEWRCRAAARIPGCQHSEEKPSLQAVTVSVSASLCSDTGI